MAHHIEDLDYAAIGVFLRLGFFLGNRTPWRGVRAEPPPGMGPDVRRTLWDPPEPVDLSCASRDQLTDCYIDLFRDAVSRQLPEENYVMPLSGGKDSRHIFLELARQGRAPTRTVTAQRKIVRDPEVIGAAAIAAHVGVPHETVQTHRYHRRDDRRKNELTRLEADEHGWFMPLARRLMETTRVSFDGIGGDVLSAGLFLSPQRIAVKHRPEQLADLILSPEEPLRRCLTPDFYRRIPRDEAIETVAAEYQRWSEEPNPIGAFFFRNRTRREIAHAPFSLLHPVEVRAPYLDPELVEFLRSIPDWQLSDHSFHLEAINRAFPQSKEVPYAGDVKQSRLFKYSRMVSLRSSAASFLLQAKSSVSQPHAKLALALLSAKGRMPPHRLAWLSDLEAHRAR